jgi:thiol-disulfide isomerase/thioredoxin
MLVRNWKYAVLAAVLTVGGWAADLPRKSPELDIHMANGKSLLLSQYRGKIVVLAFISTTCSHCQALMPVLSSIQHEYAARGVQVLGAAFNPDAQKLLPQFLQQYKPAFPLGWEENTSTLEYLQLSVLNPGYVPKMVFIDRAGIIRVQHAGGAEDTAYFADPAKSIRATLEEMLKAPARKKK